MTFPAVRIQDVADILIMTFLVYQLYSWFRKTRAMQVLLGLGVVTLIYFATRFLGLYMTNWVLQELATVLIVLVIVVFQAEIRQALYRLSLIRYFFDNRRDVQQHRFSELAETLFLLAEKRIGALVVLQREELLADYLANGVHLDCAITPQILETIFYDGAPLHDGAVVIVDGRIAMASCHLPLSISADIPHRYGTRHRAALGLSERSDAVVLVVSEERGEVSSVIHGEISQCASVAELITLLERVLHPETEKPIMTLRQKLFADLLPKVAFLLLVTVFWALVTSRQGQITTVSVPLRFHGVPDSLMVLNSVPEELEVQLKSLSSLAPPPSKLDVIADMDLSSLREGRSHVRVKQSDLSLPPGVAVSTITPSAVTIQAEKKARKKVPVVVRVRGSAPKGYRIVAEPAYVEIEGAEGQVAAVTSVATELIDGTVLAKGTDYHKNIMPLPKSVRVIGNDLITIRVLKKRQ